MARNEVTGAISLLSDTGDPTIEQQLRSALDVKTPHSSIIIERIEQYKFAAIPEILFPDENGDYIRSRVHHDYITSYIKNIYNIIEDQTSYLQSYSHDTQYIAGAIRIESRVTMSGDPATQPYRQKLHIINSFARLLSARGSYYKYLTEDEDIYPKQKISILSIMDAMNDASFALSRFYNKEVRTEFITRDDFEIYSYDFVEFIPLTIVENAIKYGPDDVVVIVFDIRKGENSLVVSVGSLGQRMTEDELQLIFNPGYRSQISHKRGIPGHGIGLYQARVAAQKLLNGDVNLRQGTFYRSSAGIDYAYTTARIEIGIN